MTKLEYGFTLSIKKYVKIYNKKFAFWTQIYGLIICFGGFLPIWMEERTLFGVHHHPISFICIGLGLAFWCINKALGDMDFKDLYNKQISEIQDKISRGELPPERLEQFRRMF